MDSKKKKIMENIITDRRKGKHIFLDNRLISYGTFNLDEINVDMDAFFNLYSKEKETKTPRN